MCSASPPTARGLLIGAAEPPESYTQTLWDAHPALKPQPLDLLGTICELQCLLRALKSKGNYLALGGQVSCSHRQALVSNLAGFDQASCSGAPGSVCAAAK